MGLLANPVYCVEISKNRFNATLVYDVPVYLTSKMTISDIKNEVVYLTSINKSTGQKVTHVFDNTKGETLTTDYLYFVKVTDLHGNVTVEETRIYAFDEFPHQKVYGMCDSKCKVEVPTKEAFDYYVPVKISKSGIDAVVETQRKLTITIGNLPDGFTYSNCKAIAVSCRKEGSLNVYQGHYSKMIATAEFQGNKVLVGFHNYTDDVQTITDMIVDIVLQRI